MPATLIDGKSLAAALRASQKSAVEALAARGVRPGLAAVLVGDDPASRIYVTRVKARACEEAGVRSELREFPAQVSERELLDHIAVLNGDSKIHGI
ncbi:MAG: tetrahydrofolate dehydrogenase/cyclohydrolase catalytic domain-containing protein, partial [Terriglobales bacterium]